MGESMIKKFLIYLCVIGFLIACGCTAGKATPTNSSSTEAAAAANSPSEDNSSSSTDSTEGAGSSSKAVSAGSMQKLLTETLALRQVVITLEDSYPDGKAMRMQAEVDSAGNYRITKTYSSGGVEALAASKDVTEAYIIDGSAYYPDDEGKWVQYTGKEVCAQLETLLRGPDGPGLWLDLLPNDSYNFKGDGALEFFESKVYVIDGEISGRPVSGEITLQKGTFALLRADFTLPDSLFHPETPASTPMIMSFTVEMEDVSPFTVDTSNVVQPDEESAAGGQTSPPEGAGEEGALADMPVYEGAENVHFLQGMLMYTTSAARDDVAQFYQEQMPALGYEAGEEDNNNGMVMQTWNKGSGSYTVVIMTSGSETNVIIQPAEE